MKINKLLIAAVIFLMVSLKCSSSKAETVIHDYTGECIQYLIQPTGKSEYTNFGTVDLEGVNPNLVTMKSKILFVDVRESIFYDPQSSLPHRTERTNAGLWFKESRTEEYDQQKFTVLIKKFKGKKLAKEKLLKADGPIQNMNTLLFYLRKQPGLKIGWHFTTKIVNELKLQELDLKLLSLDEITVPGGTFQAYHFKSVPDTFEIWIDKNNPRVPLKIKIKGIVSCTILMKSYSLHNN